MKAKLRERESTALRVKGIPIGNLTSQLFANFYMNAFDQFIKNTLKVEHYARYTDDFIVISHNRKYLEDLIKPINEFLTSNLQLNLHPKKISIRKYSQGIDFLGYVILPYCKLLRKRTWNRVLRKFRIHTKKYNRGKVTEESLNQSLQSYLGILGHADAYDLSEYLKNQKLF